MEEQAREEEVSSSTVPVPPIPSHQLNSAACDTSVIVLEGQR